MRIQVFGAGRAAVRMAGRLPRGAFTAGASFLTVAAARLARLRWWTWPGAWFVAAALAVAGLVAWPDNVAVHRVAVVALAVALLVAVARHLSKPALRLAAAAVLVAAVAAAAWIGDRVEVPGPGNDDRAEAGATLDRLAVEAETLYEELPCDSRRARVLDIRLCEDLAETGETIEEAGRRPAPGEAAAIAEGFAALRREVIVRLLPNDEEGAARLALAESFASGGDPRVARAAEVAPPPDERDLRELVVAGVDRVATDAVEPVLDDPEQARLGAPGWVVLLGLLALGYRRLEVINNRRYGGPVVVADVAAGDGPGIDPELTAVLRNRVAELDLRDPAPVPGSGSTARPTADIVAGLGPDPAPPAGRPAAALSAVRHTLVPAPGMTVLPAHAALGHCHTVSVRLVTPDRRRTLAAASFSRSSPDEAARAAADFAVCHALARGVVTPSWARWRCDDGSALGAYRAAVADTGPDGPGLALRDQVDLLETSRAASPSTGVALVELGHRYELDERPLDALRAHLVTRALHPRFPQARYRTAASLSMLAAPGRLDEHWLDPARADDRAQIADLLVDSGLLTRARRSRWWRVVEPRCPAGPAEMREWLAQADPSPGARRDILKVFLLVGRAELVALERRTGYAGVMAGALRQSERHAWLQLLGSPTRRRAEIERYRSARWIAELRLTLLPAQPGTQAGRALQCKVDALAERAGVGSTALYNAACFTSVLAERAPAKGNEQAELQQRAVRYLARVALRGRGPTPSSGWLTTDPDLVSLQAVPAFNDLVRYVADDEERRHLAVADDLVRRLAVDPDTEGPEVIGDGDPSGEPPGDADEARHRLSVAD